MRTPDEMIANYQPTELGNLPWEIAANRMIAIACFAEYVQANYFKNGERRKRYVPYIVPEWVKPLTNAIGEGDEVEAKRIMMLVRQGCLTMI